jgi:hypothetical protein
MGRISRDEKGRYSLQQAAEQVCRLAS